MHRLATTVLCAGLIFLPGAAWAQQATTGAEIAKAYGARVGVRNERPDAPGSSQDVRTVKRLPTRIGSRIATRVERYADPNRGVWAYSVTPDDGSRRPATAAAPPRPSRPPVNDQGDAPEE